MRCEFGNTTAATCFRAIFFSVTFHVKTPCLQRKNQLKYVHENKLHPSQKNTYNLVLSKKICCYYFSSLFLFRPPLCFCKLANFVQSSESLFVKENHTLRRQWRLGMLPFNLLYECYLLRIWLSLINALKANLYKGLIKFLRMFFGPFEKFSQITYEQI